MGERLRVKRSVGENYLGEKSVGEKSFGENRGGGMLAFVSLLLR